MIGIVAMALATWLLLGFAGGLIAWGNDPLMRFREALASGLAVVGLYVALPAAVAVALGFGWNLVLG